MISRIFVSIFTAVVFVSDAYAYGPIGHQIVGAIADARLANTPAAAKIATLLDGLSLEKASVIPDEIKGWDKRGADDPRVFHYSARPALDAQLRDFWRANQPTHERNSPMPSHHWFHYTDVPVLDPEKYADGKTGRTPWDIVHMTRFCVRVLRGEEPEKNPRSITKPVAVVLLAHYIGDLHEPLHVGAEYFDQTGHPSDPDKGGEAIEDQGGNTLLLKLKTPLAITGNSSSKLHAFWDNDAVMANLPALPPATPKEERRAKIDAARAALVQELATHEPTAWRLPAGVNPADYAERWADDILPIAREAHQRLAFENVTPQQQEDGVVAVGVAAEKDAADHRSYGEWAARTTRDELHKAGWRLADLLQSALK